MAEFVVDKEIEGSVDAVWNVVADFGGLTWAPGIESCEVEGPEGVGQIRKVKTGPVEIHERLEEIDRAARRLRYSIVQGPLPVDNYLATVELTDAGAGRTQVRWGARFEAPDGMDEGTVKAIAGGVEGSYSGMVDALATAASK